MLFSRSRREGIAVKETLNLIYNNDRIGIFENQGCPDVLVDEFDEEELAIRRRAAAEPAASGLRGFCKESNQGREGIVVLEALHELHRIWVACFVRMESPTGAT